MNKRASRLLLAVVLPSSLLACHTIDPAPFLGKWQYSSGGVVQTCNGDRSNSSITGDAVVTQGTKTDLIFTFNNCTIGYDLPLAGNSASAKPQSCGTDLLRIDVSESSLSITNGRMHQVETGSFTAFGTTCVYNTDAYLTHVEG